MQQDQETSSKHRGRFGCWGLFLLSLPAQYLAYCFINVYMQGYNSWRDSLFAVPLYVLSCAAVAAVATAIELPFVRSKRDERPVSIFIIARLLTVLGVAFLPIALGLINNAKSDLHPNAAEMLFCIPLICVVLLIISGWALMRMWRWGRIFTICSIPIITILGGIMAARWYSMTVTTPGDWVLFPSMESMILSERLLASYLTITLPLAGVALWCLMRRRIVETLYK